MQVNNNLSPIPFYISGYEQDRRKWYAYGDVFRLYAPSDRLVPFFVHIPKDSASKFWNEVTIHIFRVCECGDIEVIGQGASFNFSFNGDFSITGGESGSYAVRMANNGLKMVKGTEYDTLIYYATPIAPPPAITDIGLPNGEYYFRIDFAQEDNDDELSAYSDVFVVQSAAFVASKVRIEWRGVDNLEYNRGFVPYAVAMPTQFGRSVAYRNVIYLDTDIAMPEYSFTEEGEERNGYFYPTRQISEKVYKMRFTAPEYLCDAMRLIRMSDYVEISHTLQDSREMVYDVGQFEMEVEWLEQGHYADVQCSFKTDTIVKKIGKAYNV